MLTHERIENEWAADAVNAWFETPWRERSAHRMEEHFITWLHYYLERLNNAPVTTDMGGK